MLKFRVVVETQAGARGVIEVERDEYFSNSSDRKEFGKSFEERCRRSIIDSFSKRCKRIISIEKVD